MQHAMLSASGSERWMTCTPSARLEAELPEQESIYADEGTLAHKLSEILIRAKAYGLDVTREVDLLINNDKNRELYSEEMYDYAGDFAEFIVEKVRQAPEGSILLQERRFNLQQYIPEGFGTSDATIVGPGFIDVNDFKYGKGVPVSAYENPQMLIYALGAYEELSLIYPIEKVYMTIYQPRIDNISTYEITVQNLLLWAREVLRPTALKAFQGLGEFVAGDHCKFCRARSVCKAAATLNLQLAKYDFNPPTINDEQLVKFLKMADALKRWITGIEKYALDEAIKGKVWPGMKLVRGRSNRKVTDETALIKTLQAAGYKDIMNSKVKGITELTKILGKDAFEQLVEPYLEKPLGAPTLVPDSDGRPLLDAAEGAKADFEVIE